MAATARLIVMMDPAQKRNLEKRAKAADLPVAELVRQRLTDAPTPDEAAFFAALVELGQRIDQINANIDRSQQAIAARERAANLRIRNFKTEKALEPEKIAALADYLQPAFDALERAAQSPRNQRRRA